jgi:hypothetical protein
VALRIGNLADSTHISIRIGGDVRRVVVAAPGYLESRAAIQEPSDLSKHDLITFTTSGWNPGPHHLGDHPCPERRAISSIAYGWPRQRPRKGWACRGCTPTGRLRTLLRDDEPPPLPVHVLTRRVGPQS